MKSEQLSKLKQVLQRKGVTDQGPGDPASPASKLEKSLRKKKRKKKQEDDESIAIPAQVTGVA